MSICDCDTDTEYNWYWEKKGEPKPFDLPRRRRCINCDELINKGSECQEIDIISYDEYGNEKDLASKWLCENCNDLTLAIEELNGCYKLGGETLKEQIIRANEG